jgi:hypothetical protein
MNTKSLSIEELIYSFYSEGFFEQGNALKEHYFGDLSEEKMDLLLQITCRSLLAKNYLTYHQHKFELKEDLKQLIASLNYSDKSVKASKHNKNGKEDSISFNFTQKGIIKHSLIFDEQVHQFHSVEYSEVVKELTGFFGGNDESRVVESNNVVPAAILEEMMDSITENKNRFDLIEISAELKPLYNCLVETDALLNTLIIFEFNEKKEPTLTDISLLTNDTSENFMMVQNGEVYEVSRCTFASIDSFLKKGLNTDTKTEKEQLSYEKL